MKCLNTIKGYTYWKEIQKEKGTEWKTGQEEVRNDNRRILRVNEDVKMTGYSEKLMNVTNQGKVSDIHGNERRWRKNA